MCTVAVGRECDEGLGLSLSVQLQPVTHRSPFE